MSSSPFLGKTPSLKAIILLASLKQESDFSHTEVLSELLVEQLKPYGVRSTVIRLVDFDIKPGVATDLEEKDDWPGILKQVLASDIVLFATPIWWGMQSSLMQRIIERMDALNDELLESGKSELGNKVGGIVITGAEDGAQHIIGNLSNFMIWNGLTLPPACSLSFLGSYENETKESLLLKFRNQKSTSSMAKTMARNLVHFARLLKKYPLPEEKGAVNQSLR